MKITSHSGSKIGQVCLYPLMKFGGFLSFGFLSCIINTLCWLHSPGSISVVPHKTWGVGETEANTKLMLSTALWVTKSFVSDPRVSCLLPASMKLWQSLNYYFTRSHSPPSSWWHISYPNKEFKMLSHLFSFFLITTGAMSCLQSVPCYSTWERECSTSLLLSCLWSLSTLHSYSPQLPDKSP